MQVQQQLMPLHDAAQAAWRLFGEHGGGALIAARNGFQRAIQFGDVAAVELWSEVCAILAVRPQG